VSHSHLQISETDYAIASLSVSQWCPQVFPPEGLTEKRGEGKALYFRLTSAYIASRLLMLSAKLPPDKIEEISKKTRDYFDHTKVTHITHDIILAYGRRL
jgi:hypothetical protein